MIEDQLLFRSIKGLTSEDEEQLVRGWRAAEPANEARYHVLEEILAAATRSHRLPRTTPPAVLDLLEASARRPATERRAARASLLRWLVPVVAAASVVVGAGLVGMRRGWFAPRGVAITELVTGTSETTTVSLSDGTIVRLAPRSRLRFDQRVGGREVMLTGRAFFAVAKQQGKPFRVRTTAGDLTVLGTRFDVDARDADLRMVVVEGKVAVAAAQGGETRVTAGQLSRVVDGRLMATVRIPDLGSETKWLGRFLAFQNASLREVAKELERVYSVRVVVDSAIADRTVTTWFTDRSLDEVVRIVCAVSVTTCSVERGVVSIAGS